MVSLALLIAIAAYAGMAAVTMGAHLEYARYHGLPWPIWLWWGWCALWWPITLPLGYCMAKYERRT